MHWKYFYYCDLYIGIKSTSLSCIVYLYYCDLYVGILPFSNQPSYLSFSPNPYICNFKPTLFKFSPIPICSFQPTLIFSIFHPTHILAIFSQLLYLQFFNQPSYLQPIMKSYFIWKPHALVGAMFACPVVTGSFPPLRWIRKIYFGSHIDPVLQKVLVYQGRWCDIDHLSYGVVTVVLKYGG